MDSVALHRDAIIFDGLIVSNWSRQPSSRRPPQRRLVAVEGRGEDGGIADGHRRRFGRREPAAVDAAEDDHGQRQDRERTQQDPARRLVTRRTRRPRPPKIMMKMQNTSPSISPGPVAARKTSPTEISATVA